MNRIIIILLILQATSLTCLGQRTGNQSKVASKLSVIVAENESNIFVAFYSVSELRPFSIIQFDKTIELYSPKWVAAESYADLLDNKDKQELQKRIAEYLESMPAEKQNDIIEKIDYWCVNERQFRLLIDHFAIKESDIIRALNSLKLTSHVVADILVRGDLDIRSMSDMQRNEAINLALNIISSKRLQDQLKYYSKLFNKLSEIMAVK